MSSLFDQTEDAVSAQTTIQGRTCSQCGAAFRAIGYHRADGETVAQARVVYRCGCEVAFLSCETRTEFHAANGRWINRNW